MISTETLETVLSLLNEKIKAEPMSHSVPDLIDAREEITEELQLIQSFNRDIKKLSRIGR